MTKPSFAEIDDLVEHELLFGGSHFAKARGKNIDFRCPAGSHEEGKTGSCAWSRESGWHCTQCGAGGNTTTLAGLLGIQLETAAQRIERSQIVATYDYRDEDGELRYQKVRFAPKDFRIRQPKGNGWDYNRTGQPHLLYRLPELLTSKGRVYIVEGEKDADSLTTRGLTATTSADGATLPTPKSPNPAIKWPNELNYWLRGRDVVVVADLDTAGVYTANALARRLVPIAASVRYLQLPGEVTANHGYDVSDWLGDGGSVEKLEQLADAAPLITVAEEPAVPIFQVSDAGNAEMFAHLHGENLRWDHTALRWLLWKGGRWRSDVEGELTIRAKETARTRLRLAVDLPSASERERQAKFALASESAGKIKSMVDLARDHPPISDSGKGWDSNPMLLGMENGVINLVTGEFRPATQADRITMSTGLYYDPTAECPRWDRFIPEIFQGDAEIIDFIHRLVGYSMTGSVREQIWPFCFGEGSNGKNSMLETIAKMLGDYAAVTPAATLLTGRDTGSGGATPDLAILKGKRFVVASEPDEGSKLNAGRLKSLVGDENISARPLYGKPETFPVTFKLWLMANNKPKVADSSEGFWRRVRLISFGAHFNPDDEPDIKDTLKAELPGIFNWALQGAVEWSKRGLAPYPAKVMLETNAYRQEEDSVQEWKSERVILGPFTTPTSALYQDFLAWSRNMGKSDKDIGLTVGAFGTRIGKGLRATRDNFGHRAWHGIRLREKDEEYTEEEAPLPKPKLINLDGSELEF